MRKLLLIFALLFAVSASGQTRQVQDATPTPGARKIVMSDDGGEITINWLPTDARKGVIAVPLKDPEVGDLFCPRMPSAGSVTRVTGGTVSGTVTIMVENRTAVNGSPTDMLSAGLQLDAGDQSSCPSGCDVSTLQNVTFTAGQRVCIVVDAINTPVGATADVEVTFQ